MCWMQSDVMRSDKALTSPLLKASKPRRITSAFLTSERGWCHAHYLRWVRLGDVLPARPIGRRVNDTCTVEQCSNTATARGLCGTHRYRKKKTGSVQADKPVRTVPGTGYVHHTGYVI